MKAFKPDGSRWFSRSAAEVMAEWLDRAELLDWLERTVVFEAGHTVGLVEAMDPEQLTRELSENPAFRAAVLGSMGPAFDRRLNRLRERVVALRALQRQRGKRKGRR